MVDTQPAAVPGAGVPSRDLARIGALLTEAGIGASVTAASVTRLGGLTNRNYLVRGGARSVVVRLPGAGTERFIDRWAEVHNTRVAAKAGVGPRVVHASAGALVTEHLAGAPLTAAQVRTDPDALAACGRLLARVHHVATPFRSRFDAVVEIQRHRAALDEVPPGTDDLVAEASRVPRARVAVPCHNDPWPPNFLAAGEGLRLVDWEYSAMGDPAWDLADLTVEAGLDAEQRDALLAAYAAGPPGSALRERVAALEPVTDVLWGLWYLVRAADEAQAGAGEHAADAFVEQGRARLERAARRWARHGSEGA